MLNEQILSAVSGGGMLDFLNIFKVLKLDLVQRSTRIEVLDLTGISGFIGGMFGSLFGGVSASSYKAIGDDGSYGTVRTIGATVKPVAFGTNLTFKDQHIKVINADSVRDLQGMQISVGAVSSFPTIIQDKLAEKGIHMGEIIGIAAPVGKGVEVSLPFERGGPAMVKLSTDSTTAFVTGPGTALTGVEMYATVSFSDVKVEGVDRVAQMAYHQAKS